MKTMHNIYKYILLCFYNLFAMTAFTDNRIVADGPFGDPNVTSRLSDGTFYNANSDFSLKKIKFIIDGDN